jgi:hypothetical protein
LKGEEKEILRAFQNINDDGVTKVIKYQIFSAKRKTIQPSPGSSEIYSKTMQEYYEKQIQEEVIKNQNSIEDGATGDVAINDTPEESYESIFAEAANRFSNLHG